MKKFTYMNKVLYGKSELIMKWGNDSSYEFCYLSPDLFNSIFNIPNNLIRPYLAYV